MDALLEKRKSKIDGHGVFAASNIKKGERFYSVPISIVYDRQMKRCARIGEGRYVCDERILNYVNHSCEPNSELRIEKSGIFLRALVNIKKGEELTVDYEKTELKGIKRICNCHSKKCRKFCFGFEE